MIKRLSHFDSVAPDSLWDFCWHTWKNLWSNTTVNHANGKFDLNEKNLGVVDVGKNEKGKHKNKL